MKTLSWNKGTENTGRYFLLWIEAQKLTYNEGMKVKINTDLTEREFYKKASEEFGEEYKDWRVLETA